MLSVCRLQERKPATAVQEAQRRPYRFVLLGLVLLVQGSFALSFMSAPPLFTMIMEDYGLARATASLMVGLPVLMMGLLSLPFSLLASRVGLKQTYAAGAFLVATGILIPFASSFPMLLALRVLLGLGMAVVAPLGWPILMPWFQPRTYPLISTVTAVWASLSVTLAMFVSVPLADAVGWQNAMGLFAAVALLAAVAWLVLGRVTPTPASSRATSIRETLAMARQRNTLVLGLGLAGAFSFYTAMTSWLPTYYFEVRGMTQEAAGRLTGLLPFVGMAGTIAGGVLASVVGRRRPFLIVLGVGMSAAGLGAFLTEAPLLYLSVVVMGFFSWMYQPSAFTLPMELPGMTPQKLGVMLATALGIGNLATFFSPLLVGAIADASGSYVPGLAVVSGLAVLLSLAGYLLPETGPKGKSRSVPAKAVS